MSIRGNWIALGSALVALALAGCGGSSSEGQSTGSSSAVGTVTALGTPVGTPVEQTIGPAGGSLQSADGRFVLTVPAGALAAATKLSLQQVTNNAPGAVGPAFMLDTGGVDFVQPATLQFKVLAADQAGVAGLGLAVQDTSGGWSAVSGATLTQAAAAGRTHPLAAPPDIISDQTVAAIFRKLNNRPDRRLIKTIGAFAEYRIDPSLARVSPNQSVRLNITACEAPAPTTTPPAGADSLDELAPLACVSSPRAPATSLSATAGTVAQVTPGQLLYTAPSSVPSPNPVTVSATYNSVNRSRASVILIGKVEVVGGFAQRYTGSMTFSGSNKVLSYDYTGGATLAWSIKPDEVSVGDVANYSVAGSAQYSVTPIRDGYTCGSVTVSAGLAGSMSVFDPVRAGPSDPYASSYYFSFFPAAGALTFTYTCTSTTDPNDQFTATGSLLETVTVPCPNSDPATVGQPPANSPKYSDITKLAGQQSWQCGAGGTTAYTGSGTWSFDAVP